jgi:hypothetical protein
VEAEINLIVLRSTRPELTRSFYEALGLLFVEEQHASTTTRSGLVLEIYPLPGGEEVATGT